VIVADYAKPPAGLPKETVGEWSQILYRWNVPPDTQPTASKH